MNTETNLDKCIYFLYINIEKRAKQTKAKNERETRTKAQEISETYRGTNEGSVWEIHAGRGEALS